MFFFTDIETTGLSVEHDVILSLGIIITDDAFQPIARREWILHCPQYQIERMTPKVLKMHTDNGLIERAKRDGEDPVEAEFAARDFIRPFGQHPMAGNSIHFDRTFLKAQMPDLEACYHYRNFDVSTLRLLCHATVPGAKDWKTARPKAHTSIADLENSLEELAHWREVLRTAPGSNVSDENDSKPGQ